ncbi:hypothetical protein [Streptacidiphilus cavernicola]|uniref:Uncharacterized protein n=1 Tax=Streptacidiphilus cavernicola TaxID=3342716 RepID=A0ABV6VS73_9ACTN
MLDRQVVLAGELRDLAALARQHAAQRGDVPVPLGADPAAPAASWEALRLALLRLAPDSDGYQQVLSRLRELAEEFPGADVPPGAGGASRWIVPPLPGIHGGIELPQLASSRFAAAGRLADWAVRAEQAVALAAADPALWWVGRNGTYPLAERLPDCLQRYRDEGSELLGRLQAYAEGNVPAADHLTMVQQLDGWCGGLLHKAPAEQGSWWWNWRAEVAAGPLRAYVRGYGYRPVPAKELAAPSLVGSITENACGGERDHGSSVQWVLTTPLVPSVGSRKSATVVVYRGRLVERPEDYA